MSQAPQLVLALDVDEPAKALAAAATVGDYVDLFKVGLELFLVGGPGVVAELVDGGARVFLDLKLHDIPATVASAVRAARRLGVDMLTLHASGGSAMIAAAVAAREQTAKPSLLGVTVLTSLDARGLREIGHRAEPGQLVSDWARLAKQHGCDGVVASAHEARSIKQANGPEFLVVTPGIRPAGQSRDDQARVATPTRAVAAGADYLVVGRPILAADDPVAAAKAIRAEMEKAHGAR